MVTIKHCSSVLFLLLRFCLSYIFAFSILFYCPFSLSGSDAFSLSSVLWFPSVIFYIIFFLSCLFLFHLLFCLYLFYLFFFLSFHIISVLHSQPNHFFYSFIFSAVFLLYFCLFLLSFNFLLTTSFICCSQFLSFFFFFVLNILYSTVFFCHSFSLFFLFFSCLFIFFNIFHFCILSSSSFSLSYYPMFSPLFLLHEFSLSLSISVIFFYHTLFCLLLH